MSRNLVAGPTQEEAMTIFDNDTFLTKLRKFISDGSENMEIVADFDMTFSRYKTNGVKSCNTYQLIQTSVLSSDRISYIKSLCDIYRPIEIDTNMPLEIKEKHMEDWWRKSDDTLLEEGFYEADLIDYIYRSSHYFRYGLPEFLNKCYEKETPITIVSGGLGNIIDVSLKQIVPRHNIKIIANYVQFDEMGKSKSFAQPGVRVDKSKFFAGQRVRKNVFVIGDHPSVIIMQDAKIINRADYECCIKIGFLNDASVFSLNTYQEAFDVAILNDGDFTFINLLLALIHKENFDIPSTSYLSQIYNQILNSI
jgi:HAD superfamily hydrolase (TIGR01544 family)